MTTPAVSSSAATGPIAGEDPSIIYPSSDGIPMAESDTQRIPLMDTSAALSLHFSDRPDVYVSADILIYYEMGNPRRCVAPDVLVVIGVPDHRRDSYFTWRDGKPPDFVLEITSNSTQARDATAKRDIYAAMGVTEYWRYDPTGRYFDPPLIGEVLDNQGQYRRIDVSDRDRILRGYSEVLGLDLCVLNDEFRLYDPMGETWLPTLEESDAARRAADAARWDAETRANAATQARRAAESRANYATQAQQAAESRAAAMERLLREHGIAPPDAA